MRKVVIDASNNTVNAVSESQINLDRDYIFMIAMLENQPFTIIRFALTAESNHKYGLCACDNKYILDIDDSDMTFNTMMELIQTTINKYENTILAFDTLKEKYEWLAKHFS